MASRVAMLRMCMFSPLRKREYIVVSTPTDDVTCYIQSNALWKSVKVFTRRGYDKDELKSPKRLPYYIFRDYF